MCFSLKRRANRIETNPGMVLSAYVLFSRSLLCSIPLPRTRRCTKTMVGRTFLARETPCCQLVWHYDPRTPSISGSHLQAPPKNWFHVAGARCSYSNEKKNPWDLQCITRIIRMCAHTRACVCVCVCFSFLFVPFLVRIQFYYEYKLIICVASYLRIWWPKTHTQGRDRHA